jgi:hypothetical protein
LARETEALLENLPQCPLSTERILFNSSITAEKRNNYPLWYFFLTGTIGQKWPQYKGLIPTPLAIKKNFFLTLNVSL